MRNSNDDHWDSVYRSKPVDEVSWFEPNPIASLDALTRTDVDPASSSLIDVGGGASALVDKLLALGWRDLAVLDIAADALEASKARLREKADVVEWVVADIARWTPGRSYDVWHDRAVFHFLIDPEGRASYRQALKTALPSGGHAIIATFAPDGPEQCSGLPVHRYSAEALQAELGEDFDLIAHWTDIHRTPNGRHQPFTWTIFLKRNPT